MLGMTMTTSSRLIGIAAGVVCTAGLFAQPAAPPTRSHHPDVPYQSPTSLGAASYAKVLCSAVFVSGRDAEEAKQNSAWVLMTEPDRKKPITADELKLLREVIDPKTLRDKEIRR